MERARAVLLGTDLRVIRGLTLLYVGMKHLSPVLAWSPLIQEAPWSLAYLFFSSAHENGVRLSLTGSLRGLRKRVRVCTHMPGMVPSISRKNT